MTERIHLLNINGKENTLLVVYSSGYREIRQDSHCMMWALSFVFLLFSYGRIRKLSSSGIPWFTRVKWSCPLGVPGPGHWPSSEAHNPGKHRARGARPGEAVVTCHNVTCDNDCFKMISGQWPGAEQSAVTDCVFLWQPVSVSVSGWKWQSATSPQFSARLRSFPSPAPAQAQTTTGHWLGVTGDLST